jgi:uncharacterized membrane protein
MARRYRERGSFVVGFLISAVVYGALAAVTRAAIPA